jgi:excisionase family DNA binding protein
MQVELIPYNSQFAAATRKNFLQIRCNTIAASKIVWFTSFIPAAGFSCRFSVAMGQQPLTHYQEQHMDQPIDRTGLANVKEARQFLRVSNATLYRLMKSGHVPFRKLGRNRRIPWPWLTAFVAGQTQPK